MTRKKRTHLRGQRGQAFADRIRGVAPEQILCVSIDIHKYFHVVMLHNALGEIVAPTFEIDIYQTGFERLCQAIDEVTTRTQAQVVLIGMEPTSHYFENLAHHLQDNGRPVTLINSFAVKKNRDQQMMRAEKDDEIDAAAIGDLLKRGEGTPYRPARGLYLDMQQLERVRVSKVKIRTMLKNQVIAHLDRICPGLVLIADAARERYTPLFVTEFWHCQTMQHLIRVCPNPHQLSRMSVQDLIDVFHARGHAMGPVTANKILRYVRRILLPNADLVRIRSELLTHDLDLLDQVQSHITQLEDRLCSLVSQTSYQIWTRLKGLSTIQVASLAAAIGDPANYGYAGQVFRRSGLVCGRNDSGTRQRKGKGKHVTKAGDVYIRRNLINGVRTLLLHQPVLYRYFTRLQLSKPAPVALVATARRAMGILWAIQRDQRSDTLVFKKGQSDVDC